MFCSVSNGNCIAIRYVNGLKIAISHNTYEILAMELFKVPFTDKCVIAIENKFKNRIKRVMNLHESLYEKQLDKLVKDIRKFVIKGFEANAFKYITIDGKIGITCCQ